MRTAHHTCALLPFEGGGAVMADGEHVDVRLVHRRRALRLRLSRADAAQLAAALGRAMEEDHGTG